MSKSGPKDRSPFFWGQILDCVFVFLEYSEPYFWARLDYFLLPYPFTPLSTSVG